jgi:quercetin dioxygenase-like cupin family protein
MYRFRTIFATGIAIATVSAAIIVVPAVATPSLGGFRPVPIFVGTFGPLDVKAEKSDKWDLMIKSKGRTDLRVTEVNFPAGSSSGWHSHPGPNLLTVKQGSVVEYDSDNPLCTGTTYNTGDTFGDNGGTAVHLVRNEGSTAAIVMAVALYPHGVTPTTDSTKSKPNNCDADVL